MKEHMPPSACDGSYLHRKSSSYKQNRQVLGRDRDQEITELKTLDIKGKSS